MAQQLLEGEGWRDGSSMARDGALTLLSFKRSSPSNKKPAKNLDEKIEIVHDTYACPKRFGSFGHSTDFLMRRSVRSEIDSVRKL